MRLHKFAIGQFVDFDTRIEPTPRTKGPYQVLRVLPVDDDSTPLVYRIKSQAEPFERNANEYEIVAADSPLVVRSSPSDKQNKAGAEKAGGRHRTRLGV
jgi:hypothetical protein